MLQYNHTFKAPRGDLPQRSLSPPNAFIEPLSPLKPEPIEPSFNYPAITSHVNFTEPAFSATPAGQSYEPIGNPRRHQRTPSTIDTLAEAALAVSPSVHHMRKSSDVFDPRGYGHGHRSYHGSEPPHKRARSELLPSPHISQYAARPATSYAGHAGNSYNTRVEEAALLLNFQSGGWPPSSNSPLQPDQSPGLSRPHANSFPQDAFQVRSVDGLSPPSLLPPFDPQQSYQTAFTVPGPNGSGRKRSGSSETAATRLDSNGVSASYPDKTPGMIDGQKILFPKASPNATNGILEQKPTISHVMDEAVEAPKRRGWPKGKPRGVGLRKNAGDKSTTKRVTQKKTSEAKGRKMKNGGSTAETYVEIGRRKSVGDSQTCGEPDRRQDLLHTQARAQSVPLEVSMMIRAASTVRTTRRRGSVNSETICASCAIARETTTSRGEMDEWICCNGCKKWFHIDCAGFKRAHEVRDVDKYFCAGCEGAHGKTSYVRKSTRAHASVDYAELQRGVLKTSEESVEHHYIQPIKDGTFEFDPETFPRMRPEMVTKEFFEKSGTFTEPICIPAEWNPRPWNEHELKAVSVVPEACSDPGGATLSNQLPEDFEYDALPDEGQDRLEMVMPESLTVRQVCNLVGSEIPLDVIDVKTQNSGSKWTLGRWADYYEEISDEKAIRNVISLEVSQTKLGRLLQRPKIVRDIDLQDDVWPQEEKEKGKWPKVQFYCLMSVADSYTDFHIDFGGSSVYYHILRGKKTFFFIPPKAKHLKAYEEWNDSPQQNYTFLPHITKECYRVDLTEGDTMLIPSGWIHAVWTPDDSLVIGGNFLNRMAYKNQFKVVDIEKANETPMKFRYPFFQRIMWYTAIKYLRDDPLPASVCQAFYEGKRFEREHPVWADFDGAIAQNDVRVGAHNARYYSQAEVDGLPDLVNFIFRTVMLVLGRLEGVSQDRMKRVNASIPKGYGEPLEVAKTFALWVAWKRGNEDPPAWAHPDAVLPNSKEEGPPKKLSERKLRELERREAIAAYRVAPDRQSARVMSKNAAAISASAATDATSTVNPSPSAAHHQNQLQQASVHSNNPLVPPPTPPAAPPAGALLMAGITGQHLSTPKTSVLGPKRIACDACRKRRIRCKHKDVVVQASPDGNLPMNGVTFHSTNDADPQEAVMVTPTQQQDRVSFVNTVLNGQHDGEQMLENGTSTAIGSQPQPLDPHSPLPGTNAYVNANIPMTMNGVPIFGEAPKRGRSKACYECRKSKRRCIHDENGNVDPIKAAETPVLRGSINAKKRPLDNGGNSFNVKRTQSPQTGSQEHNYKASSHPETNRLEWSRTDSRMNNSPYDPMILDSTQSRAQLQTLQHPLFPSAPPVQRQQSSRPPEIDPNLFSLYTRSNGDVTGGIDRSHETERGLPFSQHGSYEIPSLEQIANEVLVDMTGNEPADPSPGHMPNGHAHEDPVDVKEVQQVNDNHDQASESVDSAVSIQPTEDLKEVQTVPKHVDGHGSGNIIMENSSYTNGVTSGTHLTSAQPSLKASDSVIAAAGSHAANSDCSHSPAEDKSKFPNTELIPRWRKKSTGSLPLYQPPAPICQSPRAMRLSTEMRRRSVNWKPNSPQKRKLDRGASPGVKKVKIDEAEGRQVDGEVSSDEEKQSIELARMLQQEEMGLRRRSK